MRGHVTTQELALFARGDLSFWGQRVAARHVGQCEECAGIAAEFASVQSKILEAAGRLPIGMSEREWAAMQADMTANVRLGIAAGECVSKRFAFGALPLTRWTRPRLALGLAGLGALVILVTIERDRPVAHRVVPAMLVPGGQTLESNRAGVEVRYGNRALGVRTPDDRTVLREVSLRGESGARYVDESGVTIVNVIAE